MNPMTEYLTNPPLPDPRSAGLSRILMTVDAVGGVWTYALELSAALARLGIQVTLASMGELPSPSQRAAALAIPNLELHESNYKLEWMNDPWRDVEAAGRWLLDLADAVRPDLVHLNGYAHAALPWRAPVLVVAHSCVCSWFSAVRRIPAPPEWDAYRAVVTRGLRAADGVVAPTAFMLRALRTHYNYTSPGDVIPNGLDPSARLRPSSPASSQEPPCAKEPFIFTAGRLWDEAKNIAALDQAAHGLPWPVFAAGSAAGPDGPAVALPHLSCVGQLAPAPVTGWMDRAMVFALPALYEPFGLTPLEAALSGCALVLGDIPSLREVWRDAALFVPPRNAQALRAALDRVMSEPGLRQDLAARARARAASLSAEKMLRRYLALYLEMLEVEQVPH